MLVTECTFAPRSLRKEIMDGQAMLVDCPAFLGRDGPMEALSATESRQARSVRSVDGWELSRTGARYDH